MLGPTLETERLILRPPIQADLDAWAACMGDEEAQRYIGGAQPREVAWRAMATMVGGWSLLGFAMFSVLRKSDGLWIGRIGPWRPEGWPGCEVGWGLAREAWGRGYALEAASACMDWAFDHLGWTDVIHTIDPQNAASITLAHRLGSTRLREAALPPPFAGRMIDVYGQTAAQWRARQATAQR
jgi:RimJ/RimL family protein N-acetyltransferase